MYALMILKPYVRPSKIAPFKCQHCKSDNSQIAKFKIDIDFMLTDVLYTLRPGMLFQRV